MLLKKFFLRTSKKNIFILFFLNNIFILFVDKMFYLKFVIFGTYMYFLYPNFLWALSLLLIPVIIHFFNIRRYKKIYFSDVKLIKQITQESQVKSKLKEYIVLIIRLLALSFLVFSFAQPVFNKNKLSFQNSGEIVIYIDNSFSMENVSNEGKLFEIAINRAKEIIMSFSKSTKFIILTNDIDFKTQKILSQTEAIDILSKIKISSSSVPLSVIFNRIQSMNLSNPVIFLISDAQKKFTNVTHIKNNKYFVYYFLLSAVQKNNVSIDSVWIDNPVVLPGNSQQLHVKISNHNKEQVNNLPLKLILNDIQTSIINISIPANQSVETTVSFIPKNKDFQFGKIFINDFPVNFDDEMYFSVNTNIRLKVMLINGFKNPSSSKYIKTFFQNDSVFIFSEQQEKQIDFSELSQQDVVVLNEITEYSSGLEEQLKILSQKGKTIIVIPFIEKDVYVLPYELQYFQWKVDTLQQNISNTVLKHPLFSSAFEKTDNVYKMPVTKEYLSIQQSIDYEPLVEMNNNKPLLFKYQKDEKRYFVFTSTLRTDKNKLALHSLFVPLMYQLSFSSVPRVPLYYYCGITENIKIPNLKFTSDNSPKIVPANNQEKKFQIVPMFKTDAHISYINIPAHYEISPGHYYLQWKEKNIFSMSFNYNRAESDMQFYSQQELEDIIKQYKLQNFTINNISKISAQKIVLSEVKGKSYWKLCLILALTFFLTESMVLRLMK